jgi:single-stranded DNA-binding protein
MSSAKVNIPAGRVASVPTYFMHNDPAKACTSFAVITNSIGKDGKKYSNAYTIRAWGKLASVAALLTVGKQVAVEGNLMVYKKDEGVIGPNGKKKIHDELTIRASEIILLGDSMKTMEETFQKNLNAMKIAGTFPPNINLSLEVMLRTDRPKVEDFNMTKAMTTGKYINARVWSQGRGYWDEGKNTAPQTQFVQQPVQVNAPVIDMAAVQQMVQQSMAQILSAAHNPLVQTAIVPEVVSAPVDVPMPDINESEEVPIFSFGK